MEYRRVGQSSLVVSALGLGCMGVSEFYGNPYEQESIATIHHAIDCGITLLDTAEVYGMGRNEELVGRAMEKRRNELIVATKIAIVRDASNLMSRPIQEGQVRYLGLSEAKTRTIRRATSLRLAARPPGTVTTRK